MFKPTFGDGLATGVMLALGGVFAWVKRKEIKEAVDGVFGEVKSETDTTPEGTESPDNVEPIKS